MDDAIEAVHDGMSLREASRQYNVPPSTLSDKLRREGVVLKRGRSPLLPEAIEDDICDWAMAMSKVGLPVTPKTIRQKAREIYSLRFRSVQTRLMDKLFTTSWFRRVKERHPQITTRHPQSLASSRQGLNLSQFKTLFDTLTSLYKKESITPDRVFNADETAINPSKLSGKCVVTAKGCRAVPQSVPAQTIHCTMLMTCIPPTNCYAWQAITQRHIGRVYNM